MRGASKRPGVQFADTSNQGKIEIGSGAQYSDNKLQWQGSRQRGGLEQHQDGAHPHGLSIQGGAGTGAGAERPPMPQWGTEWEPRVEQRQQRKELEAPEPLKEALDSIVGTVGGLFSGLGFGTQTQTQTQPPIAAEDHSPSVSMGRPWPVQTGQRDWHAQDSRAFEGEPPLLLRPGGSPPARQQHEARPRGALKKANSAAANLQPGMTPSGVLQEGLPGDDMDLNMVVAKLKKKAKKLEEEFRAHEKKAPRHTNDAARSEYREELRRKEDAWQDCLYEINAANKKLVKHQKLVMGQAVVNGLAP
eukprot:CAMPEP_0206223692 /NCGR_PEP_ID=MMETSP0047_2-20121206/6619_1 /ASSEMBLY_ACC=CAM_ASM_000192 /TAXON_ID=195065 /ORGANISM="Chroomonas mesostigmatica_cf, Strain CCMP1168" /LENGTH=303 /DNA_ID=CAMNT_0053646581 /DNA_START=128 /DNA_END=1039 /DNA_ORIENTATION=-